MEKILFSEEQRHKQWWLWLILILAELSVVIPFFVGIYSQEVLQKPFGENPMGTGGLVVTGVSSVLLLGFIMLLVARLKLKTKITTEGLYVAYPPLKNKWRKITQEDIDRYEVRTYRAGREFGGYGIKRRRKHGLAYIVSGNTGLQIWFKNGNKLLIGTQKKQAIIHAMDKMMEKEGD